MAMSRHPYPSAAALVDDCAACAADEVIMQAGGPAWDADGFARLVAAARDQLAVRTARVIEVTAQVLAEAHEAEVRLTSTARPCPGAGLRGHARAVRRADLPRLHLRDRRARLPDLIRYLRAMVRRLDKLAGEQARDAERMAVVRRLAGEYRQAVAGLPAQRRADADVVAIRWMLEELRVNLFAQLLGTPAPVSEKRILTALTALTP